MSVFSNKDNQLRQQRLRLQCASRLLFFLATTICCLICHADMDEKAISEQNLNNALFKTNNYNPLIRPVVNTSESLAIDFSLALSAIIDVDEKNQVMVTNVWLQTYWYDYQLAWDPAEYSDIRQIKINHTYLWVPEIVLFNNADGNFEPSYYPNCVLDYTGEVTHVPPAIYTSSCTINVEYFPFDQQVCEMKFGSWTFQNMTLVYAFKAGANHLILSDYMKNGAWDIVDCAGEIVNITDTASGDTTQFIMYQLVLRRKTLFYTVNLIIPCFLHAFSCLWVFLLPTDGCEKVTLVISVLVSLVVLLLVLQKILPPSKTIPLIAKYFIFTFIMNVLEIGVSIGVIYCSYKGPRTADIMPKWICWLFLYTLPKYLLMKRPHHESRWQQKSCTPPPSYPNTPMVPRANLAAQAAVALSAVSTVSAAVTADIVRQRRAKSAHGASKALESSVETTRAQNWRHKFSKAHSPGVTMSSSTSGSHASDESPTIELSEFPPPPLPPPLKPLNGHRCMLQDSGTSQSSESIDCMPSCSKRLPEHHRSLPRDARLAVGVSTNAGTRSSSERDGPVRPDFSTSSLRSRHLQQRQQQQHTQQQRQHQIPQFVLTKEIYSAANAIKYICHQMQNREDYDTVIDDWKYFAAVIDRLLMIVFVVVSLSGTLSVLFNAPHFLETVDEDAIIAKYSPDA